MIDDTNVNCDHEWHDYVQAINRPDGGIYVPAGKTARDIAGFEYLGQMCAKCGKVEPPESVVNPKLPATGPYVDRIIRIFRDRCYDDASAIVLHDYAVEALRLNTAIAQQPSNAVPDDSCNWQQEDCESDCWSTDCGNLFSINDGTPSDNQMAHCCYCGKKVTETPWAPEDDQDHQP
jgi:hypothetical protein